MARVETKRYDVKLDSFLRRTLPSEDYERVSTSEASVVLSPDDKRVHRHVVLGHHSLYLTEFPPKSLKVAVHLRDVETVKMLDDLPDFLSGKEQEDTVHVQICYRRVHRERSIKSPAILKAGGNSALVSKVSTNSFSSSQDTVQSSKHGGSSISLASVRSHSSYSISPGVMREAQLNQRSRSLGPMDYQEALPVNPKHSYSSNITSSRSNSVSPKQTHTVPVPGSPSPPSKLLAKQIRQQHRHLSVDSAHLGSTSSLKSAASSGLARSSNSVYKASAKTDALKLQAAKKHGSSPDFLSLVRNSSLDRDLKELEHRSSSLSLASSERASISSLVSSRSVTEGSGSVADGKGECAVMDIYVLKHTTDFYHQLCVTWENFKIGETLASVRPSRPSHTSASHDHFSQHFCTLKQELLSARSLESSAQLAQELCMACQKYFVVKRLFWEDSELFEFCTGKLQSHLASFRGQTQCGNKADEIEYLLILMDLLYQMLRETHFSPKKLILLTRNNGQLLLSLATVLVTLLPKCNSGDHQVECFDSELTEKSSAVLYELVQVTQQARWPQAWKTTVSTAWLFTTLSELPTVKDLCARLVFYVTSGIGKSSSLHVEPSAQTQVTLYHVASLLSCMATNSPAILEHLRTHFKEEFRYFISATRAKLKLPASNPLSKDTVECLQNCKMKVLQSQCPLAPEHSTIWKKMSTARHL